MEKSPLPSNLNPGGWFVKGNITRNRETGEILEAEILTEEWSRAVKDRGVTRGSPGDYRLTDANNEQWGIRDIHLPLIFEVEN